MTGPLSPFVLGEIEGRTQQDIARNTGLDLVQHARRVGGRFCGIGDR
jgi:hypothetical protein